MGKETDNLIALANEVSTTQPGREMDMLLTIGERKRMALVCMALADLGVDAVSFTGSQVGIITDTVHGKAKILEVKGDRVRDALADGKVCVVAGFQGVSTEKEITTLGRGGVRHHRRGAGRRASSADSCEIYTDVTGVFSADPGIVPAGPQAAARHLRRDARDGRPPAGGCWRCARSSSPATTTSPLHVRSSFTWEPGTWVTEEEPTMEDPIISGVTHDVSEAKVTVSGVPDRPGVVGGAVRAAGRRQHQRRHDRAEHVEGRHRPTSPSRCPRPTWRVAEKIVRRRGGRDRRRRRRATTTTSPRCRLVGRGHEDQPGHRRQDVPGRWPTTGSTSR